MAAAIPPTPDDQLEELRRELACLMPAALGRALKRVLDSYETFAERAEDIGADDPAKSFKEHHLAGKAALSHIEALVKLLEWSIAHPGGDMPDDLAVTIAEVTAEMGSRLAGGDEEP